MNNQVVCGRLAVAMLLLAVGACGAGETDSKHAFRGGIEVSDDATAADAGLPTYPGAREYKEAGDSSSGANIGIATPLFGFKVVALKLQTSDEPERVAAFYRRALSKYGAVLECSDASQGKWSSESGDELVCDPDEDDEHSVVYKVGTQQNQRIVAIKSHGSGTRFDLVHLVTRGDSKQ